MPYAIKIPTKIFSIFITLIFLIIISTTESKSNTLEFFKLSIDEAMKMYSTMDKIRKENNFQSSGTMSEAQMNSIIYHAQSALNYSYKVNNDDLDKLDRSLFFKDFKDKYDDLFREGLKQLIVCYDTFDTKTCKNSDKLLNKWGDYYTEFREKLF